MRAGVERVRLGEGRITSSHAFVSLYLWRKPLGLTISLSRGGFTVRRRGGAYFFPCGTDEYKYNAVSELLRDGRPSFEYLSGGDAAFLSDHFPGAFRTSADRDASEYVYRSDALASLRGADYYSVRREIKAAAAGRAVTFEPVTDDNIPELCAITEEWNCLHAPDGETYGDTVPARDALNAFRELELFGALARLDGRAASYIIASDIGDAADVHLMKSSHSVGGNDYIGLNAFAKLYGKRFSEINCEEDLGIEGLRDRKSRMKPSRMITMERSAAI